MSTSGHHRVHPSLQPEEDLPDITVEKLPSDNIGLRIPSIHKVNAGTDEKISPDIVLEDFPRGKADEVPSIPTVDAGADEKYLSKGLRARSGPKVSSSGHTTGCMLLVTVIKDFVSKI